MGNLLFADSDDLTAVANHIRNKGGTSASLEFPNGFTQAIDDIPTGGGITITNLLANCTWSSGYFNSSGGIDTGSRGEMYCNEYIDVDTTKDYIAFISNSSNRQSRTWVALYDSNNNFQSMQDSGELIEYPDFIIRRYSFNQPKIRFSFRSFKPTGYQPKISLFCKDDVQSVIDILKNSQVAL